MASLELLLANVHRREGNDFHNAWMEEYVIGDNSGPDAPIMSGPYKFNKPLFECLRSKQRYLNSNGQAMYRRQRGYLISDIKTPIVTSALERVDKSGHVEPFKSLVYSSDADAREALAEWCSSDFFFNVFLSECCVETYLSQDIEQIGLKAMILVELCQSGLLRETCANHADKSRRALMKAVRLAALPMIKLYYHAGIMTTQDIAECLQTSLNPGKPVFNTVGTDGNVNIHGFQRILAEDRQAHSDIRDFLNSKASEPRPLHELCLMEVSRHMGWGHTRQTRVSHIPKALFRDWLNFKDCKSWLKPENEANGTGTVQN